VRGLLADDVRLDLVSRRKAAGRRAVATYFGNYERACGWRVAVAWFDGREVLAVCLDNQGAEPRYFIELGWCDDRVVWIRDFRYVPYIAQDGRFEAVSPTEETP
jgi:RNA polymerase sigma-70 factor (ECF subfamily)